MNKKQFTAIIILVAMFITVFGLYVLLLQPNAVEAGPKKPCRTWGEIKTCYTDNPAPCCSVHKFQESP